MAYKRIKDTLSRLGRLGTMVYLFRTQFYCFRNGGAFVASRLRDFYRGSIVLPAIWVRGVQDLLVLIL